MLQLYNTLTKKKEIFKPLKKDIVTMYNCGPTVYSFAHIGNFSSYLMADLLRRYLEYLGYKVRQVKNITDVGHLVSDADSGEDKLEKAARLEKKDPFAIARYYEQRYLDDENKLRMLEPFKRPRATEHVSEMIDMIKTLVKKGYAYETADGVYFEIARFPDYGKLSGNTLEKLQAGKRIEINEQKKNPYDFALWKKLVGENAHHVMRWESPWGPGFPGWHIECSAMSRKYLGEEIDIHTGGEDNIFPHHECEIAQSEAFSGKKFVHYWLHKRWFYVDGQKMSKSLGNIYTLEDIEKMGFDPLDLRFLLLSVHYRAKLNFTLKGLKDAAQNRAKLNNLGQELIKISANKRETNNVLAEAQKIIVQAKSKFEKALDDDLNTSAALAAVLELAKQAYILIDQERMSASIAATIIDFMYVFNQVFMVLDFDVPPQDIPQEIMDLVKEREMARKNRDYGKADKIREMILREGFEVRDNKYGQIEIIRH